EILLYDSEIRFTTRQNEGAEADKGTQSMILIYAYSQLNVTQPRMVSVVRDAEHQINLKWLIPFLPNIFQPQSDDVEVLLVRVDQWIIHEKIEKDELASLVKDLAESA